MNYYRHIFILLIFSFSTCFASDPLPSWNDGKTKQSILNFVQKTTDKSSSSFVPLDDRIAVFDQDGTLWVEKPFYTQLLYCLDKVSELTNKTPELKEIEPFKTVLSKDLKAISEFTLKDIETIEEATLTGISTEEFQSEVNEWIATAKDSRWKKLYTELTYQPMQEVLKYFQENGYKTYIVTGGGQDFVRVYSKKTYGIPTEQIVGTAGAVAYTYDLKGKPILIKTPKLLLKDNFEGKPEGIHLMIGKRPQIAFGNSTGDRQMLEYTNGGSGLRLSFLVLHDDPIREYAYGPALGLPDTKVGAFTESLYDEAIKKDWIIISMKNDWNRIFSFESQSEGTND